MFPSQTLVQALPLSVSAFLPRRGRDCRELFLPEYAIVSFSLSFSFTFLPCYLLPDTLIL